LARLSGPPMAEISLWRRYFGPGQKGRAKMSVYPLFGGVQIKFQKFLKIGNKILNFKIFGNFWKFSGKFSDFSEILSFYGITANKKFKQFWKILKIFENFWKFPLKLLGCRRNFPIRQSLCRNPNRWQHFCFSELHEFWKFKNLEILNTTNYNFHSPSTVPKTQ